MDAGLLAEPVAGVGEALAAVSAFDRTLAGGLLRPQPAQAAGLAEFAGAVAGTPLASRVAEAAEKAAAGAAGEEHLVALAAARTALLGSVHDALMARLDAVTGRARSGETAPAPGDSPAANLHAAARSWLCDLARAGWRGIDHDLVSGSAQVVPAMLPDPALRRLAALLDGFAAELAESCPGAAVERIPVRRWADLWSRAMVLTQPGAAVVPVSGAVSGRLLPLGIDLQEHPTAAQVQVHAVFEPADGTAPRLVRASASALKPVTVVGAGVWQLLRPCMSLLAAVSEGRSMDLADMPITLGGDLIWHDEHACLGEPADAFATARVALPAAAAFPPAPLDRHPARIAEPVFLEGYRAQAENGALAFGVAGHQLVVDAGRVPAAAPLTREAVALSGACIGLLRWDAGTFSIQPLAVETTVKKKAVAVHAGAWAGGTAGHASARSEQAAVEAVAVLRERARRLLRK